MTNEVQPGDLAEQAIAMLTTYQRNGDVTLLGKAVEMFRAALAATAEDRRDRHIYLSNLGGALQALAEATGDAAPLAEAVFLVQAATEGIAADHPDRAGYLANLCATLRSLADMTGDPVIAAEAVRTGRAAVSQSQAGDPAHARALANLAGSLLALFDQTRDIATITEAARYARAAVAATPAGHPERVTRLSDLGVILRARYERTGDTAALAEAAETGRAAIAASSARGLAHARRLGNLAMTIAALARRTGDQALLREAAETGRAAVRAYPPGQAERAAAQSNLSTILRALAHLSDETAIGAEAIEMARQAVAATPPDDPDLAGRLSNLGASLLSRWERTGQAAALREAVQVGRLAIEIAPAGHPARFIFLSNLGDALRQLAERTGDTSALREAVSVGRDAVASVEADDPRHASALANLANALVRLFEQTTETADGQEAVRVGRLAVAVTFDDDAERPARLSSLGIALYSLYQRTGEIAALEEAISVGYAAVAATPAGHPNLAMHLGNLGNSLRQLAAATGQLAASEKSADIARQAVAAVPEGHPQRPAHLVNLANALGGLFDRTGDADPIIEAVQAAREAVALSSDWPDRFPALSALSGALQRMSGLSSGAAELEQALQAAREAVGLLPAGHADMPGRLSNLGGVLLMLYQRTGATSDLDEAVDAGRKAVSALPADYPGRAAYLLNLAGSLQAQYLASREPGALAAAEQALTDAGQQATGPVRVRIAAYRELTGLPDRHGRPPDRLLADAEAAIRLLPQAAPRTLARTDRERALGQVQGLGGRAAAAALTAGQPARAVELLEQARGVMIADSLDARGSDRVRLREQAADLAVEFDRLLDHLDFLDRPLPAPELPPGDGARPPAQLWRDGQELADARRRAQEEWQALIERIRVIDGLSDFLRAPDIARLAVQAQEGPVVFLNAAPTRCDAVIVTSDANEPVIVVELGALTEDDAYHQVNRLLRARRTLADPAAADTELAAAQSEFLGVLAWAWDAVAGPVLDALGYCRQPETTWPRLWWCPVGVLGFLPWHAAGHHEEIGTTMSAASENPRTVLDRVVSSYAITIRALAHARARRAASGDCATIVIAVPDAPGARLLDGARKEARLLAELVPQADELPHPTRLSVLAALPRYAVAHFACHGVANWAEPSASRLLLYDCDTSPMTVADVSALRLTGGLAYLSACDTGLTNPSLIDEAVHITGAFHLAGYQHVIGALWPVSDEIASMIAIDVYRHLTTDGTRPPDVGATAEALHHATRRLRAHVRGLPVIWAPLTHTGI